MADDTWQFILQEGSTKRLPAVAVDGIVEGAVLTLSHWPGNDTPERFWDDLSTGCALRFAATRDKEAYLKGARTVVNNHFDTDGVLPAWIVMHSKEALRHRRVLLSAAEAGDFRHFTTPEAVQFTLAVEAYEDPDRSPIAAELEGLDSTEAGQLLYDTILPKLPKMLYDVEAYADLWREPYRAILDDKALVDAGKATRTEHLDAHLSVFDAPRELDPMACYATSRGDRLLLRIPAEDGRRYRFWYRTYTWFDIVSRPTTPRHDLSALAEALDGEEPSEEGRWTFNEWDGLSFAAPDGRLATSALPPEQVVAQVKEALLRGDQESMSSKFRGPKKRLPSRLMVTTPMRDQRDGLR